MIIKQAERRSEERMEMRGGIGNVFINHIIDKEEMCGSGRMFAQMTVPPGHSVGNHDHIGEREIYYVIQGEAKGIDDGKEVQLKAGDVMITKDGSSHSVENTGDVDLEIIALILFEGDHE